METSHGRTWNQIGAISCRTLVEQIKIAAPLVADGVQPQTLACQHLVSQRLHGSLWSLLVTCHLLQGPTTAPINTVMGIVFPQQRIR